MPQPAHVAPLAPSWPLPLRRKPDLTYLERRPGSHFILQFYVALTVGVRPFGSDPHEDSWEIAKRLMLSGFSPVHLSFNDEYLRPGNPYGHGLYWGFQFLPAVGNEEVWKMDVWGYDPVRYAEKLANYEKLKAALRAADRSAILLVKSAVCKLPEYRNTITSADVYEFVLARAGTTVEDFRAFLARKPE